MGIANQPVETLSMVSLPWVKHESRNAADPCITQLISMAGFEGYGRYWRLIELLSDSKTHEMPPIGERGSKRYQIGLGFTSMEALDSYLNTLLSLDLAERTERGCYRVPLVDRTANDIANARANGSKGGRKAALNRRSASI